MVVWDIGKLTQTLHDQHGKLVADRFHSAAKSFAWKQYIASFHREEAKRIFRKAVEASIERDEQYLEARSLLIAAFANDETNRAWAQFRSAKLETEAHAIAAAQAIHSMGDIMANACYWAMRLDRHAPSIELNRLSLRAIRKVTQNSADFSGLHTKIMTLFDSKEWKYLNAFVNTTKHVSLIFGSLSASFVEDRGGIILDAFEYDRTHYAPKWLDDLLEEFSTVYRLAGAIGLELTRRFTSNQIGSGVAAL